MKRYYLLLAVLYLGLLPTFVFAIPPPDFLLQVGSQFFQIFTIIFVIAGAVGSVIFRWVTLFFSRVKNLGPVVIGFLAVIVVFSSVISYFFVKTYVVREQEEFDTEVEGQIGTKIDEYDTTPPEEPSLNLSLIPIVISNEEFEGIDTSSVYILDAREDEEYALGHYPGSRHIRLADLLNGEHDQLPKNREVIVICWSGMRGQQVAEFLRTKGIASRYVEDGASGWVEYGGLWDGEISFSKYYSEDRYKKTFTTSEVRNLVSEGVLLIDARDENRFAEAGLAGSTNISAMFTPSDELEEKLGSVPEGSTVITVCDDYLSCFDAKIVGVKLERYGHTFLGRYSLPHEYE